MWKQYQKCSLWSYVFTSEMYGILHFNNRDCMGQDMWLTLRFIFPVIMRTEYCEWLTSWDEIKGVSFFLPSFMTSNARWRHLFIWRFFLFSFIFLCSFIEINGIFVKSTWQLSSSIDIGRNYSINYRQLLLKTKRK